MAGFRVLQFNMQYGQIWDDRDPDRAPIRLEEAIQAIQGEEADVILLQEVENARDGGVQIEPPPNYNRLKVALDGYHSVFSYPEKDPRELPFGIGLAIFCRYPLTDFERHTLPAADIRFDFFGKETSPTRRLLIGAKTVIDGREVQLLNTHLQAYFMIGSSSEKHPAQRRVVAERLEAVDGPGLLAGDFNTSGHDSLIEQMREKGFETVQDKEITWRRRPYVLDHIFHNRHLRPVKWEVKPTRASDHHLVTANFEFAS